MDRVAAPTVIVAPSLEEKQVQSDPPQLPEIGKDRSGTLIAGVLGISVRLRVKIMPWPRGRKDCEWYHFRSAILLIKVIAHISKRPATVAELADRFGFESASFNANKKRMRRVLAAIETFAPLVEVGEWSMGRGEEGPRFAVDSKWTKDYFNVKKEKFPMGPS